MDDTIEIKLISCNTLIMSPSLSLSLSLYIICLTQYPALLDKMADEQVEVKGKLSFNRGNVLASTSGLLGSIVYRGKFENELDAAVKRVLKSEATLKLNNLRAIRGHPNLVQYYCREYDDNFW